MLTYLMNIFSRFLHLMLGIGTPRGFPPPLSADEERKCFRLAAAGDADAREKLIVHNLRLVSHIVRKYYSSSRMQEDLVSVGSLGLIKAVDSFDIENGARFATYAAKCIQNEILMYFRQQRKLQAEVSINDAIDVDRDGNPLTYIDVISCEENLADDLDLRLDGAKVRTYVDTVLGERERQIVKLRYGLDGRDTLTQREVAALLGISRSYVSRIEKSALEKLRSAFGR
ncbi:MAG: RNA polymerase sporulation sigma factor SigK [Eubacteriales bacterium]|nr:RNA polymerase sporulation sigma factor SigK [Clostridiales bacterium]MDD7595424.1 RNA polymerase sporulation sigma factor SigK [Clostridiales bacterium]MDY4886336.1 RNA polymerase sporulation sigma factor SigK [Eubacteriales bacterium]MDY5859587.1 RNA polymerase sporulation sigma factor SigK [Eubacteriales bacterium]HCG68409.1 RNA polymerase subunit sigma-70 [Clostridiales bacterium]